MGGAGGLIVTDGGGNAFCVPYIKSEVLIADDYPNKTNGPNMPD